MAMCVPGTLHWLGGFSDLVCWVGLHLMVGPFGIWGSVFWAVEHNQRLYKKGNDDEE